MTISELIADLEEFLAEQGDLEVVVDVGYHCCERDECEPGLAVRCQREDRDGRVVAPRRLAIAW